jgi:hypothetical protein
MGTLIATFLKGLGKGLATLFPKLSVKFVALFAALGTVIDDTLSSKVLGKIAIHLAQLTVSNDPNVRKATSEMSYNLGEALWIDYFAVKAVIISCIIFLVVFIVSPLIYKALSRRRLGIFISFNRTRETISETLQKYFENEGAQVFRIPFQEGATHQSIVMEATEGIKRCDSFVCLPGYAQSYVEHEVLAATTSEKPIVFLISEDSGTVPNTADKRYPMFRLETTSREQFKPLIHFISYVGADLKSTWKLCQRALRHPLMHVSARVALGLLGICLVSLWVYCYFNVTIHGHNLTKDNPAFVEVERAVVIGHIAVLIVLMSIAFCCFSYIALFLVNLVRQFKARMRARLKTVAAQFNRDDWIGVIPDLSPGKELYECLFDTAPSAHHEI